MERFLNQARAEEGGRKREGGGKEGDVDVVRVVELGGRRAKRK